MPNIWVKGHFIPMLFTRRTDMYMEPVALLVSLKQSVMTITMVACMFVFILEIQ